MFILGLICLLANANNQFEYLGIILLVFSIVAIVVTLLIDADTRSINKEKAKEYNEAYSHFEDEFSRIKRMNSLSKKKNQEETFAWSNQRKSDMAELNTALDNTEQLLKELYSLDFIYDKYRNLPALTSIYEYFITGRCDSLKGPHGAYNLYEDEVRKDTVISQLSTVLDHLEQVKQNQFMLYQQVKAMQENINNIGSEISTIRGYAGHIMDLSAVNAYYSALTAHNAEISATMHLLNG